MNPQAGDLLVVCDDRRHPQSVAVCTVHADGRITAKGHQGRLSTVNILDRDSRVSGGGAIETTPWPLGSGERAKRELVCRKCKTRHKWTDETVLAGAEPWRTAGLTCVSLAALAATIELLAQSE